MIVWRLSPPASAHILSGEGNRIVGARWNSPGRGVVYTCAHLSLCVLEAYVHIPLEQRNSLPDFEAVRLSVPDDAGTTEVTAARLGHLLSTPDAELACRTLGDRWLAEAGDLVLAAPSVLVPEELNVMLNPTHPRMQGVTIVSARSFRFDLRLATSRL